MRVCMCVCTYWYIYVLREIESGFQNLKYLVFILERERKVTASPTGVLPLSYWPSVDTP